MNVCKLIMRVGVCEPVQILLLINLCYEIEYMMSRCAKNVIFSHYILKSSGMQGTVCLV